MIETIVFDFGGVLLDLDMQRSFDALTDLMGREIMGSNQDGEFFDLFVKYEKGLIKDETLLWNIQNMAVVDPHPRDIVTAWNAMLLGWNPLRFNMLKSLRERYNVYLLSNTNHMHLTWVKRDLAINHDIHNFEDQFFDKAYYSHLIHHRKPDMVCYDYVTKDAGLNPAGTLFIDDNVDNIAAAKSYGWQAQLHQPAVNDIVDVIDDYLK